MCTQSWISPSCSILGTSEKCSPSDVQSLQWWDKDWEIIQGGSTGQERWKFQVKAMARKRCRLIHDLDNWPWMQRSTHRQPITVLSRKAGKSSEAQVPWQWWGSLLRVRKNSHQGLPRAHLLPSSMWESLWTWCSLLGWLRSTVSSAPKGLGADVPEYTAQGPAQTSCS